MKRFRLPLLAGLLCAVSSIASAIPVVFVGVLAGINENPPNGSPGKGSVTVTFDLTAHVMRVQTTFTGLSGPTSASHIHAPAAPGMNAGVVTQTPTFTGFPLGVTSGTYDFTFDTSLASTYNPAFVTAQGGVPQAELALHNAMAGGLSYFNIHTTPFPGGELRANLAPAVPEHGSTAVMAAGALALMIYGARRRQTA